MREETGATYKPATNKAKLLIASKSKDGKTATIVASALGVLPHQQEGGIVTSPANLHIICTDTAALRGLKEFLLDTCKAPEVCLGYKVYNLEEDYNNAFTIEYDMASAFYNTLMSTISKVRDRCKQKPNEVSVVLFSSVTTIARAMLRGIAGGISENPKDGRRIKASVMDMNKWNMVNIQLNELQAAGQSIPAHVIWEGHLGKTLDRNSLDDKGQPEEKDSIQIQGSVGASWAANVSHPFILVRQKGIVYPGTKCDKTHFDTQPNLNMFGIGRGVTENCNKQEPDLTVLLNKLGFEIGGWKPEEPEEAVGDEK